MYQCNPPSLKAMEEKPNHMIILIDAEKEFDKIQLLFMIQTLSKLGVGGNFLLFMHLHKRHKGIYIKPMANILNGKRLNVFPLKW